MAEMSHFLKQCEKQLTSYRIVLILVVKYGFAFTDSLSIWLLTIFYSKENEYVTLQ